MSGPESIVARAAEVAAASGSAANWMEAHGAKLRQDRATLVREFRRSGRRGVQLHEAAQRRMCVAVFGASQAGKSYLVGRLAAPPGGQLTVRFDSQTLDFLADINPPGGQEATGLVTRFTTRPMPTPAGAPVALRLLSQTDVIKILANTFLEDFDVDIVPPDEASLSQRFAMLAGLVQPAPVDTLTIDDVEDLADYFRQHFKNHALLRHLDMVGYWSRAADLAPRLRISERVILFAPLWGETKRFNELYDHLVSGLAELQFAQIVYCGTDALVPRERSLLDARRLFSIGQPTEPAEMLAVTLQSGSRTNIGRPVLAALIAEMTMPLAEQPWPFFQETDLLDFPGARTREVIVDLDRFLAQPENLGFALLRGKVAYLFQRYNAEQEITSMLLCVGPNNQEVQTLPSMVNEWIKQTLGDTPQARARQRTSLFFVLTKFDSEFEDKAGEDASSATRWTARLQASLTDFFKSYEWPGEWTPDRPFNNLFWLRNPSIGFKAVFDYEPTFNPRELGREIGVAPRAAAAVAQKRNAYLANDLVRKHVADPAIAWDAALAANDGGVGRLAEALGPVCDPTLKANQIAAQVEKLAGQIAERLRPLWRSDDREAELVAAKARAAGVVRALVDCARAQMFGPLLRAMQISAEQVAGVHWTMQNEPESSFTPIGTVASADEYANELADLMGDVPLPTDNAAPLDYFEHFAGMVVATWDEMLGAFAADAGGLAALLVGQLGAAARRTDLRGRIAGSLRERASFHGRATAGSGKIALVAEDMVNSFVTCLGYDLLEEARRPTVGPAGPNQRRIFARRPVVQGLPPLGDQPSSYDRMFHVDWMAAFVRMMEDNVSDQSAEDFDRNANDEVGAMVRKLAAAGPV
jgi:hypothetical protein